MELSWPMKLRIAAVMAVGIVLLGILGWPLVAPTDPMGVVSLVNGSIGFGDIIILLMLAFLAGLIGYFLSWPYGREIAVLAAPSGLAGWALYAGSAAGLMQQNPALAQRQAVFTTLRLESIVWLGIVAAGFCGVLLGQRIRSNPEIVETQKKSDFRANIYINAAIALIGTVFIAHFFIGLFAYDVRVFDNKLGSVLAQPAVNQIAFAVMVSFGLAAFVFKKFLDISYIWPAVASALITAFGVTTYARQDILQHLISHHPATFFSHAVISILPVQMVAFGTLGSIAGYWLAVRYSFWQKHYE